MSTGPWLDGNGNFVDVITKPGLIEPFNIWQDPWSDLSFLKIIFKDMFVPSFEDYGDSGLGDEWIDKINWEREEWARLREERIERKAMERLYPELKTYRQKKKGRTVRRRRLARERRLDRELEEKYGKYGTKPPQEFSIGHAADYDEHVMKLPLPNSWRMSFWLASFYDDNRDYKLYVVDKNREIFWPAEPIAKRTLGYELLTFMPPGDEKRSASICTLERERTREVETSRCNALQLRRSKSESDLNANSNNWNGISKELQEQFEDHSDLYIQLVEIERQDDVDQWGVDFYYTF